MRLDLLLCIIQVVILCSFLGLVYEFNGLQEWRAKVEREILEDDIILIKEVYSELGINCMECH